jgi:hypothetical protein
MRRPTGTPAWHRPIATSWSDGQLALGSRPVARAAKTAQSTCENDESLCAHRHSRTSHQAPSSEYLDKRDGPAARTKDGLELPSDR